MGLNRPRKEAVMADINADRADVYTRVTNKIIEGIEAGADAWSMPWHVSGQTGFPVNALTGQHYRGVNVLTLWVEAEMKGYTDHQWATYKQWQELGKQVAKGEKSATCVFWKRIEQPGEQPDEQADQAAESDTHFRMMGKAFSLFNAMQTEGYEPPEVPVPPTHQRIETAETFFANLAADIRHGGSKAFYRPSGDYIQMPPFSAFVDPIAYYATLAHESIHWTGAPSRMDRDLKGRFGSESYAAEELVAELGAAFISASLQLTIDPRPDHAAYVQSWLKILKADNRAIFAAASHAQRAADFLHSLQDVSPDPEDVPRTTSLILTL